MGKRDLNHPSVMFWCIGIEIHEHVKSNGIQLQKISKGTFFSKTSLALSQKHQQFFGQQELHRGQGFIQGSKQSRCKRQQYL